MRFRTIVSTIAVGLFACMKAQVSMTVDATKRGPVISPYQYGLFFEEINHAGDGGLYAELVRNRSFEEGTDGWSLLDINGASFQVVTSCLLNDAQQQAMRLTTVRASEERMLGVKNEGYWGMKFVEGSTYTLSLWARGSNDGYTGHIVAQLVKSDGKTVIGEAVLQGTVFTDHWNKLTATIKATDSDDSGQLLLLTGNNGRLDLDVVSLFPPTWKDRVNGLRPDLAQLLCDTKPAFLRFPGGCYVEGEGAFDNAFQWKKTIGPIEQRPGHMNQSWHYRSTDGLGFDEYLQLAEDMGAAPMFVVNVGLGHGYYVPMQDLDTLVQNTLDAIEYANGDGSTKWGALRIKNGHIAPYNLKFIEIGNENYNYNISGTGDQSYQYPERYYKFYQAIKAKYPEIVTIGNVEAWGTDAPGWRNDYPVELVDEHYYRTAAWMRSNYNKYNHYPRNIGVYNGEYAANSGNWGRYGNLNAALGEAIYMLGMEKNSDVCRMASFAPIFTHEQDPCWDYDMIHFNSGRHFVTPSYHVQKLMAHHLGYQNLTWTESGNTIGAAASRRVGVATWDTQASYDNLKISSANGTQTLVYDDFSRDTGWQNVSGDWTVIDGVKQQTANGQPCLSVCGTVFSGADYTMEIRARKDGGNEGFLIVFDYQDAQNYSWWNIGGWSNTKHAVEVCRNGSKTTVAEASGSIRTGEWYDLRIEVKGQVVTCFMNGEKIHEFSQSAERALYQSVQLGQNEDELILKIVNPNGQSCKLDVNVRNMSVGAGTMQCLTSIDGTDENTMDDPEKVFPTEPVTVVAGPDPSILSLDLPAYSFSIYHFAVSDVAAEIPGKKASDYPDYVAEDQDMTAYLYAHMHETQEYTCYALKDKDGNTWNDLLDSHEVFDTKANTVTGGMRDAFVYRLKSGNGFMLVGTDMTSRLGWESNHIMDLMTSPDLVHWTKNVKIDLETVDNLVAIGKALGRTMTADDLTAAWAPQVIYDAATGHYVLYYSVGVKADKHYIFYQLLDEDLNILTEPRIYFAPGYDIIDADIVWNAVDEQYQMLFKCESTNGFDRATAKALVPEKGATGTTVWTVTPGFHVGENGQAIEGMTQWRPIGELKWRLSYINYTNGYHYRTRYMDEHGLNAEAFGHDVSGNVRAQHGCVMKLKQIEYDYLLTWDRVVSLLSLVKAYHAERATEQHRVAIAAAEDALATSTTFEENVRAMKEALALLEACPTDLRQIIIDEAVENGSGDLTALIVNADFSQRTTGWSANTGFTAANGEVAEFWNKNFDFWQTIDGLPDGNYEVGVQAFYRNGGTSAYDKHVNGSEKLHALFYANEAYVPVVSLFSEDDYTANPYSFPDNVAQANEAFNQKNLYHNTLRLTIDNGRLTLGIRKQTEENSDWCCFDNFTLKYLGKSSTGIASVGQRALPASRYYNLNGQRVNKVRKGIYISNDKKIMK